MTPSSSYPRKTPHREPVVRTIAATAPVLTNSFDEHISNPRHLQSRSVNQRETGPHSQGFSGSSLINWNPLAGHQARAVATQQPAWLLAPPNTCLMTCYAPLPIPSRKPGNFCFPGKSEASPVRKDETLPTFQSLALGKIRPSRSASFSTMAGSLLPPSSNPIASSTLHGPSSIASIASQRSHAHATRGFKQAIKQARKQTSLLSCTSRSKVTEHPLALPLL